MFSGSVSSGTSERREEKKRKKSRRRTEKQQIVLGGAKAEDVMGRRRVWAEGRGGGGCSHGGFKPEAGGAKRSDKRRRRPRPAFRPRLGCSSGVIKTVGNQTFLTCKLPHQRETSLSLRVLITRQQAGGTQIKGSVGGTRTP